MLQRRGARPPGRPRLLPRPPAQPARAGRASEPVGGTRRRRRLAPPRRPRPPGTCIPLRQSAPGCLCPRDPGRAEDLLLPERQRDAGGRARAAAGLRGALTSRRPAPAPSRSCLGPRPGLLGAPPHGSGLPPRRRGSPAGDPLAAGAEPGPWMLLKLPGPCARLAAAPPSGAPAAAPAAAARGRLSSPPPGPRGSAFSRSRLLPQSCAN